MPDSLTLHIPTVGVDRPCALSVDQARGCILWTVAAGRSSLRAEGMVEPPFVESRVRCRVCPTPARCSFPRWEWIAQVPGSPTSCAGACFGRPLHAAHSSEVKDWLSALSSNLEPGVELARLRCATHSHDGNGSPMYSARRSSARVLGLDGPCRPLIPPWGRIG